MTAQFCPTGPFELLMLGIVGPCRLQKTTSRLAVILAIAGAASTFACHGDPLPPTVEAPAPPPVPIVSNAMEDAEGGEGPARTALATTSSEQLVHVSLPAGSVPDGRQATVQRVGAEESVVTPIIDGGFDPVAIIASPTDSIVVVVRNGLGATVLESRAPVPARRPPSVVRTSPPRRKSDVPLNAIIIVVFSEPVSPATIDASAVKVMRGTTALPGTVRMVEGSGSAVAFVPNEQLAPNTDYTIVVAPNIADLEGDLLGLEAVSEFRTGTEVAGEAVSVTISPEYLVTTGKSYQLSATVRDGLGNDLPNPSVAWSVVSSGEFPGIEVTATGRVTPLDVGTYYAVASVGVLADTATVTVFAGEPTSLTLSLDNTAVAEGDTVHLTAIVRSLAGRVIPCANLSWSTQQSAVAAPSAVRSYCGENGELGATLWALSAGTTKIIAAVNDMLVADTVNVTVLPGRPIASVELAADFSSMVPQSSRVIRTIVKDADGRRLFWRRITWHSADSAVAVVDGAGIVAALREGTARIVGTGDAAADTISIEVRTVSFESVSVGWAHTCGLTATGEAWCWGANEAGQLGDGTRYDARKMLGDTTLDLRADPTRHLGHSLWPIPVATDIRFSAINAAGAHTCGISTAGDLYCWGAPIGEESDRRLLVPTRMDIPQRFTALSSHGEGGDYGAPFEFNCGLTNDGTAYCWGVLISLYTQFSTRLNLTQPAVVGGDLRFSSLSVGSAHLCGIAIMADAYCWGANGPHLGAGTEWSQDAQLIRTPLRIAGGLRFSRISAGWRHSCGITTDGKAYCWGDGTNGTTGDASGAWVEGMVWSGSRNVPVPVRSDHRFTSITSGAMHSCALTTAGEAFCWGQGGKLGTGNDEGPDQCLATSFTTADLRRDCSTSPVRVALDETFRSVVAGEFSTCGITAGGTTYCWGRLEWNSGTGRFEAGIAPTRVAGQP